MNSITSLHFDYVKRVLNLSVADENEANDTVLNFLLEEPQALHTKQPVLRGEARVAWAERNWRFANVWLGHYERDVTPEMLAYLKDPDQGIRTCAVRALGRLEIGAAEAPLEALLQRLQGARSPEEYEAAHGVPLLPLQLAVGRIHSRHLKGRAKLEKVAQSVGLSWAGVLELAHRLDEGIHDKSSIVRRQTTSSSGFKVLMEFIDLLCTMNRRGEDTRSLEPQRLGIGPNLVMRLKISMLPLKEEISALLDHATSAQGGIFVEGWLLDLGPQAKEMLIKRLQDIAQHLDKYTAEESVNIRLGLTSLFRAAAMTRDPRVASLLEQFEKHPDPYIGHYAEQSRTHLEMGITCPFLPA